MSGRIRSMKPDIHLDEELWDLEQATGLHIFRAFTGLWGQADREGRFEWRPRKLKAAILPYWDGDFSRVLDALATRGFIQKYVVDGREYGVVRTFKKHQVINNREAESTLPPPPENPTDPGPSTRAPRVDNACTTPPVHALVEGKGREGKGSGGTREARAPDPPPPDPLPDPELKHDWLLLADEWIDAGWSGSPSAHQGKFMDLAGHVRDVAKRLGMGWRELHASHFARWRGDRGGRWHRLGPGAFLADWHQYDEREAVAESKPADPKQQRISELQAQRRAALDAGEDMRAAELRDQIRELVSQQQAGKAVASG